MGWAQPIFFSSANTTLRLGELLEMTLPPMGYELVDWEMSPKGRLVRVFIDKRVVVNEVGDKGAGSGVSVEDCARVSHHLTRLFTVENIDYDRLEVSSPGLDRPLTKLADYARFAGEDVQLNLHEMTDGARRWKGTLRGVEGDCVLVETATGIRTFPFAGIDRCRLVPKIEWRKGK
jgi:ribosome maturation factor RimP